MDSDNQVFDSNDAFGTGRAGFRDVYTVLDADRLIVFNVVNDVHKYPEFLKIYESVEILSDEKDKDDHNKRIRIAKYNIAIPFILKAFFRDLHYTLKLTSNYDNDNQTESMLWQQIDGPKFLVDNSGRWDVQKVDNNVKIFLEMNLGYNFYLPQHLKKYIMNYILKDSMKNIQKQVMKVLGRT